MAAKYRVGEPVGRGALRRIHRAVDQVTGQAVSLQWLTDRMTPRADAMERLLQNAHALAQLRHPNVAQVLEVLEQDGDVVLVMEPLPGETVADLLQRGGMPLDHFLNVLMGAMYGVAEAHRCGVLHRDIRPDHMLLVRGEDPNRPHVKVLGFDVDRFDAMPGTEVPLYAAPERIVDPRSVDARADVYGFGVILYRAVTGRFPHVGSDVPQLFENMSQPAVPALAFCTTLPSGLCQVIGDAIESDREARLDSLPALIKSLVPFAFARALNGDSLSGVLTVRTLVENDADNSGDFISASPSIPPSYTRRTRRRLRSSGTGAMVALALGFAALLWYTHHDEPRADSPAASEPDSVEESTSPRLSAPEAPRPRAR